MLLSTRLILTSLGTRSSERETTTMIRSITSHDYLYVTEHLPRELQSQKKRLLPIFKKAKQEGKKATWKIAGDEYQPFVDRIKIVI